MTDKRRSLKIKEENDKKIQYMRSKFLSNNIDIDYITMVNIIIDIGDIFFKSGTDKITNITDIFRKYLGDDVDNDIILQTLEEYEQHKT